MKTIIAATIGVLLARGAEAHPGHGLETGLLHFFSDPFHLTVALALAAGVGTLVYRGVKSRRAVRRP